MNRISSPSTQHCVVFDVETTGLSCARGDRIIEIGAISLQDGDIVAEFQSLMNAGRSIPKTLQELHKITNEMLSGKPPPEDVIPAFRKFIGRAVLVAHNASFDMSFLRHEFGRLGLGLTNKYYCTLEISRKRYPHLPNHKLETVGRYLFGKSIKEIKRHRALDDAKLAAMIWLEMGKV